jgi:hypothetical protein
MVRYYLNISISINGNKASPKNNPIKDNKMSRLELLLQFILVASKWKNCKIPRHIVYRNLLCLILIFQVYSLSHYPTLVNEVVAGTNSQYHLFSEKL